jgi:excisionase family DNA binding protein
VTEHLRTPKQAGEWASVSEKTVLREIAAGRLPARRIGARWRIHPADLEAWGRPPAGGQLIPLGGSKMRASTSESEEAKRGDDSRDPRSRHDRNQTAP